jgi:hypothetical protein
MKTFIAHLIIWMILLVNASAFAVPVYNSFPTASATIFLDFDGHRVQSAYWNGGNALNCSPSPLNEAQVREIFNRVAEDFRPFDLNVTTDSVRFLNAPIEKRIRIIITPTSQWKPNVGGISFITSFSWGDDTPAFVFTDRLENNSKYIAECTSHEIGHTIGLYHQSRYNDQCDITEAYHAGEGTGETGWAPIMGNSYRKNMTGWNNGSTQYDCTDFQKNLLVITSENGFGFRADDFSDEINQNAIELDGKMFNQDGIITTDEDQDVFRFKLSAKSSIHVEAHPYSVSNEHNGANLDIMLMLFNEKNELLKTCNTKNNLGAVLDTMLAGGNYYLVLSGANEINQGNLSSVGAYIINGSSKIVPIKKLVLEGSVKNQMHELQTYVESDDPIRTIELEVAEDGGNEYHFLSNISYANKIYKLQLNDPNDRKYRIKLTNQYGSVFYSNIVSLTSSKTDVQSFKVNTFSTGLFNVQSVESFQYMVFDNNGRLVKRGIGVSGFHQIDLANQQNGVYVLKLSERNQQQSFRIVKQ